MKAEAGQLAQVDRWILLALVSSRTFENWSEKNTIREKHRGSGSIRGGKWAFCNLDWNPLSGPFPPAVRFFFCSMLLVWPAEFLQQFVFCYSFQHLQSHAFVNLRSHKNGTRNKNPFEYLWQLKEQFKVSTVDALKQKLVDAMKSVLTMIQKCIIRTFHRDCLKYSSVKCE